jgi:hypothetical protein
LPKNRILSSKFGTDQSQIYSTEENIGATRLEVMPLRKKIKLLYGTILFYVMYRGVQNETVREVDPLEVQMTSG